MDRAQESTNEILSQWYDEGNQYLRAFFLSPALKLTSTQSTQVKIQELADRYQYMITITPEIRDFLDMVYQRIRKAIEGECKVIQPQSNDQLYVKTRASPILFDVQKKRVRLPNPLPITIKAKVELTAQCISKKKDEDIYQVFFKVNQLMMDDMAECAWMK